MERKDELIESLDGGKMNFMVFLKVFMIDLSCVCISVRVCSCLMCFGLFFDMLFFGVFVVFVFDLFLLLIVLVFGFCDSLLGMNFLMLFLSVLFIVFEKFNVLFFNSFILYVNLFLFFRILFVSCVNVFESFVVWVLSCERRFCVWVESLVRGMLFWFLLVVVCCCWFCSGGRLVLRKVEGLKVGCRKGWRKLFEVWLDLGRVIW